MHMRQHIRSGRQEIESQVTMSGGKERTNSAGVQILTPCWPRRGLKCRVLPVITASARPAAAPFLLSLIVRPHSQHFDCPALWNDLVHEPVLNIDTSRVGADQIAD